MHFQFLLAFKKISKESLGHYFSTYLSMATPGIFLNVFLKKHKLYNLIKKKSIYWQQQ